MLLLLHVPCVADRVLSTAADAAAAAAAAADPADAAVSAEEAELAAKQAEAARKEKILAAALAQEDAGVCGILFLGGRGVGAVGVSMAVVVGRVGGWGVLSGWAGGGGSRGVDGCGGWVGGWVRQ